VRRVLAHEAAHGQRRDVAWALLARVVCALCWFNPLAWFAAHRQRVEAELACDDAVIVVGAAADDYATDLVQILRACPRGLLSPLTAGMAARPSQIRARLAAVLAADTDRATVRRGVVWTLTVSVLLVAAALTVTRVCRAPAAKTADDDALAPVSGGARLENGQVALDLRLLKFSPQARVLRSTQFQRAWAAGDVGEIMKMAGAAGELVTAPNVVTSTGQKGVVKYVSEMNYPAERGFSYTGSAGVKMLGPSGGWPIHFEKEELGLTVEYQPRILEHGIELNLTVRSVTMNQLSPPTLDVSFNKQEMHLARLVKDGGSFAVWLPWEQGNYGIRIGRENDQPARYGLIVSAGVIRKTPVGSVADKLERIVIPRVEFADADIGAVLGYVQEQSKALDPSGAGVDMVFKASPSAPDADWRPRRALTLSLRGQPLKKILDAVAQQSGYRYRAEEHAVYVFPGVEINEPVLLRAFAVPDGFFPAPIGTLTVEALRRGLVEKGVEFLAGTQVAWLPKSRKLVVRNTAGELEKIERLLGERKGGH
jgi:hypothetical protein